MSHRMQAASTEVVKGKRTDGLLGSLKEGRSPGNVVQEAPSQPSEHPNCRQCDSILSSSYISRSSNMKGSRS